MTKSRFGNRAPALKDPSHFGGGTGSQVPSDFIVRFSEVVGSSLNSRTSAVQYSLLGIVDPDEPTNQARAESDNSTDPYSALGFVGRPLPPRNINGIESHADVIAIVTADGLVPISYRDMRLKMGGSGPSEGMLAFVGYGGGFYSLTPVAAGNDPSGGGTIHVLYCPYEFDSNGVPTKAHAVVLDPSPGNESISIVHAEGMAITMLAGGKNALLLKNRGGDATFRLDDDGITMTATTIVLSGGVIVGTPATAVPLLPGVASPGSTKFYVSP